MGSLTSERSTGAIVPALAVIQSLSGVANQWAAGRYSNYEMALLIQNAGRNLESACWCDFGVCCKVHNKHVNPHQHCILR